MAPRHFSAVLALLVYLVGITGPCACPGHAPPAPMPKESHTCCSLPDDAAPFARSTCCCDGKQAPADRVVLGVATDSAASQAPVADLPPVPADAGAGRAIIPLPLPTRALAPVLLRGAVPGLRAPPSLPSL